MNNLKEYKNEVERLIEEENFQKAYEICNKILIHDPENSSFIRLKRKIEKHVQNINKKVIKQELHRLEKLLSKGKYEEYLKSMAPLQSYVMDYPEISKKILFAKKLLDQKYKSKKEEVYRELIKKSNSISTTDEYKDLLRELEVFGKLKIHSNDIKKLIQKVKKKYIKSEIEKNKGLINSAKYEDTLIFLLKLKKIDPQNARIGRLIKKTNHLYSEFKIENKKDFIFRTSEEMKTLFLSKKYEYSLELAKRILQVSPKHTLALKYIKKNMQKIDKETEIKIVEDIYDYYKNFPNTKAFQEGNYFKI